MSDRSSETVFSVVLPTYRRPELLKRALDSAFAQTFGDFEVLVVDDASDDATSEIVHRRKDSRLHYLPQETNRGVAAARNQGVLAAQGDWVAFLDDDDEYLPEFLARTHESLLAAEPAPGWSWCGVLHMGPDGREIVERLWHPEFSSLDAAYRGFLRTRRIGTSSGLVIHRSCFDEIGLFDPKMRCAEDTDLLIRLAARYPFTVVEEYLIRIHHHRGPRLRHQSEAQALGYDRILDKHRDVLSEDPSLARHLYYKSGWLHYHAGDSAHARRYMFQALRANPWFLKGWLVLLLFELGGDRAVRWHRYLSTMMSRWGRSS